jgi:transposase-like protein
MRLPPDPHYRHRFPAEIISHAVWLNHVFSLSLQDVELILAERGVDITYETIRRCCGSCRSSQITQNISRPKIMRARMCLASMLCKVS